MKLCKECPQPVVMVSTNGPLSWGYSSHTHQTIGICTPPYEPHRSGLCYFHLKVKERLIRRES